MPCGWWGAKFHPIAKTECCPCVNVLSEKFLAQLLATIANDDMAGMLDIEHGR